MTTRPRTRADLVRASAGIVQLALQQITDVLTADDLDAQEPAALLHELHDDADPDGGPFAALAQLLDCAARRAEQVQQHPDGVASRRLHEAAGLTTDHVARRIAWAADILIPEGERA
ncbi:hypothetical protein [Streptomyces sp. NPDC055632]